MRFAIGLSSGEFAIPKKGYRKPPREQRIHTIRFRVSAAERDRILDNAGQAGMTASAFARTLALGQDLPQRRGGSAQRLTHQLARVLNNLSQLHEHAAADKLDGLEEINAVRLAVRKAIERLAHAGSGQSISPVQIGEVAHHGATINQLARLANRGDHPDPMELIEALAGLMNAITFVTEA